MAMHTISLDVNVLNACMNTRSYPDVYTAIDLEVFDHAFLCFDLYCRVRMALTTWTIYLGRCVEQVTKIHRFWPS